MIPRKIPQNRAFRQYLLTLSILIVVSLISVFVDSALSKPTLLSMKKSAYALAANPKDRVAREASRLGAYLTLAQAQNYQPKNVADLLKYLGIEEKPTLAKWELKGETLMAEDRGFCENFQSSDNGEAGLQCIEFPKPLLVFRSKPLSPGATGFWQLSVESWELPQAKSVLIKADETLLESCDPSVEIKPVGRVVTFCLEAFSHEPQKLALRSNAMPKEVIEQEHDFYTGSLKYRLLIRSGDDHTIDIDLTTER